MAWHLPKKSDGWDLNTDDFFSYSQKTNLGSLNDLLPGDAMLKNGHIELFEKWVNAGDHTQGSWVYSENDFGQKTNHNIDSWSEMNIYQPIRYNKISGGSSASDGADFNTDGIGDIFSSATGTLTIWNGRGSNNFATADAVGPGWTAYSKPVAGDFNDDGITDLAAIEGGSTLTIWNGRGGNKFSAAVSVGSGWGPYDSTLVSLGDVNGDGIGDLAAIEGGSTLTIWNGRGSNNFAAAVSVGTGWGPYDTTLMSLGDVNGDGHADIAAVKEGTGTLYAWNGRGNNTFNAAVTLGTGWTPYF
jgi:hypothetical protein